LVIISLFLIKYVCWIKGYTVSLFYIGNNHQNIRDFFSIIKNEKVIIIRILYIFLIVLHFMSGIIITIFVLYMLISGISQWREEIEEFNRIQ